MRAIVAVISIGLLACGHPTPVPVAYETTVVKASYGRTWAATLEEFSSRSIPLKSADRVSGVIITDVLHLDPSYYPGADCGDPGFG